MKIAVDNSHYYSRINVKRKIGKEKITPRCEMVRRGRSSSNTDDGISDVFTTASDDEISAVLDTLKEWEDILSASGINFEELGL